MPKNKKTNIKEISQTNTDNKSTFINIFTSCLNILRDSEGLTGEKALRNISYLLILKIIEFYFENKIDKYNHDYDYVQNDIVNNYKIKLLEYVRFSKLIVLNECNLNHVLKYLWEDILSVHPLTKNLFLKGKNFDIQSAKIFKKILDKINTLDLSKTKCDILGHAYEEIIQDIMTGKILGQFFTQPLIKKIMVKLIDPQIYPDGKIETCCDPTMGTGGFLITYLQYILTKSDESNIELDWDFIKTEGLYGKELDPDIYQLAVSNMLISSGYMFEQLERGDSIREHILRKFDNVLANLPFGIKGLKYDDFNNIYKSEYLPIKTDNAISLFIQVIIYMLKINGKCAVVLPDGQDLFSKTNNTLIAIREYLLKTCDLKEIIYLPAGIFTYTNIKTCIFYFIKKKEGSDILETKVNISKSQKEISRDYKFSKIHQTTKIIFYDFNPNKDIKNLLIEVPIEKIINNFYSLNYSEYIKDEEEQYGDDIIIKPLGEVCEINYGTRIIKKKNIEGNYSVYGSGKSMFSTITFNREGYNILIGRFALSLECVRIINKEIFLNDSGLSIKPKTDILLHKYIGYYLLHNQNIIYKCARGTAQKNLEINMFKLIKIPIPSIEKQKIAIEYLDFIYEKSNKENQEKIKTLIKSTEYCINNQKIFDENIIKTIEEVCEIQNGKRIVKSKVETGKYPVLGGGGFTSFYTNKYSRKDKTCKISREGMCLHNCVIILNEKYYLNSQAFTIESKNESLLNYYLFYYLDNNKIDIFNCGRGSAQKAIDINMFKLIKISIPSIEQQQKIIKYCEYNDILIKQLKDNIIQNKNQARLFISNIEKSFL